MKQMKKFKYLKLISLSIVCIVIMTACDDFLDVEPKGLVIANDIEHYNGLFNNTVMVNYMNYTPGAEGFSSRGSSDANLAIFLSAETMLADPYSNSLITRYRNAFAWSDEDYYLPGEEAPEWEAFYIRNYTYNLIIDEVMDADGGTEQEKKALQAEARANRALLHFMVLNFFSKPYNQSTAASDPGIPIITVPNATTRGNTRSSVQEVYDFIISDLETAIPDLPEQTTSRLRLARAAGKYILGQTYLFMGKYDEALIELNDSKELTQNSLVPIDLYDYNTMIAQWQFFPIFPPILPNSHDDQEGIYQQRVSLFSTQSSVFLDTTYSSLYDITDMRGKLFGYQALFGPSTFPYKSRVAPSQVNYGPSVPNLYLMLAECKARTDDVDGAKADLEAFRSNRMPASSATVDITDQNEMIRFIIDERLREYACTGVFWFDIRRLWNDPLFSDRTYTHTDIDGSTYTLSADRLVLRIPPEILQYNPGMEDNP